MNKKERMKRILSEIQSYNLIDSNDYLSAYALEISALQKRMRRYNQTTLNLTDAEKNMIKALRIHPWNNSPVDWARLHAIENCI